MNRPLICSTSRSAKTVRRMRRLAERMRPQSFDDSTGQEEIVGKGRPLRNAIEADRLSSVILWGPPGCGKTTLAHLISRSTKAHFVVVLGRHQRSVLNCAKSSRRPSIGCQRSGQKTILFVDEIHRFQQSATGCVFAARRERHDHPHRRHHGESLLRSRVTVAVALVGGGVATTERRSVGAHTRPGARAMPSADSAAGEFVLTKTHVDASSDLRTAMDVHCSWPWSLWQSKPSRNRTAADGLTMPRLKRRCLRKRFAMTSPAKSTTTSSRPISRVCAIPIPTGPSIGWRRMLEAGEDPKFIARRLVIFASEDIGNADPLGIVVAAAVAQAVQFVGLPEAQINLAHGTTFLATRPKDNASYTALLEALSDARAEGNLGVPLHLRNAVTSMMRDLGYGKGYRYVHDDPQAQREQEHLPEALKGRKYYKPKGK